MQTQFQFFKYFWLRRMAVVGIEEITNFRLQICDFELQITFYVQIGLFVQ